MLLPNMNPISATARGWLLIHASGTEDIARRDVAGMHPGQVPAEEKASVLKSGRQGDGRARAARTVHQIHRVFGGVPGARDIFPAHREREAVFEGIAQQGSRHRVVDAPLTMPMVGSVGTLVY